MRAKWSQTGNQAHANVTRDPGVVFAVLEEADVVLEREVVEEEVRLQPRIRAQHSFGTQAKNRHPTSVDTLDRGTASHGHGRIWVVAQWWHRADDCPRDGPNTMSKFVLVIFGWPYERDDVGEREHAERGLGDKLLDVIHVALREPHRRHRLKPHFGHNAVESALISAKMSSSVAPTTRCGTVIVASVIMASAEASHVPRVKLMSKSSHPG